MYYDPAVTEDINIFIHGTDGEGALARLESLEETIQTNIRRRTMCVRKKDSITILSRDPYLPIRISLRLYHSISQILHDINFDIDCACVAYDGKQVYALPRAITAWMTQCNTIGKMHSSWGRYEHRLLKYRHRGFEVYHPGLQRDKILPDLHELEMDELCGLARLLTFERFGNVDQHTEFVRKVQKHGDKSMNPIAWLIEKETEWCTPIIEKEEEESGDDESDRDADFCYKCYDRAQDDRYNRTRYERRIDSSVVEETIYQNDEKLNDKTGKAQEDRVGYLHRHPAFVGNIRYISRDCCKKCPDPQTKEEEELQVQDEKIYVKGKLVFTEEDYSPETEGAWTETAIFTDNTILSEYIVAQDADAVRKWIEEARASIGSNKSILVKFKNLAKRLDKRDATSRTVLQLAALSSSPEIIEILIEAGASLTIQTMDGRNLLHLAAARGDTDVMRLLLLKNEANEAQLEDIYGARNIGFSNLRTENPDKNKLGRMSLVESSEPGQCISDNDMDSEQTSDIDEESFYNVSRNSVTSSFVRIGSKSENLDKDAGPNMGFDDILDINTTDRTNHMTPLHYAIINGHTDIVRLLVSDFGADILLP
ncbi:Alpha-latrotoxin [Dactylellina cionopaga]|nr:Alpha-latrotoxin [Dactylellina cionopaga]